MASEQPFEMGHIQITNALEEVQTKMTEEAKPQILKPKLNNRGKPAGKAIHDLRNGPTRSYTMSRGKSYKERAWRKAK